jgi:hypothetical protein
MMIISAPKRGLLTVILPGFLLLTQTCQALDAEFRGQASAWSTETNISGDWLNQTGIRYLPQLLFEQAFNGGAVLDGEVMLNGYSTVDDDWSIDSNLDLYRLKLRFTNARAELRFGLQKINFGPAQLLRPLMWFDRLDPRDPLNLTEGVWGVLSRYYFQNSANIWLWGLYGNDETKGYEIFPTAPERPEFGGRIQFPLFGGETGVTSHLRRVRAQLKPETEFRERRMGLDGRWDVGVGLWFELAGQHWDGEELPYHYTRMMMIGLDYTVGIGNGIYVIAEHMGSAVSEEWWGQGEDSQISAYALSYPVSLFDTVMNYGFYDWENGELYQYIGWQRTYDNWIINPSLFWYPDENFPAVEGAGDYFGRGYGVQLIIIYNH